MKQASKLAENLWHVVSEPGDGTRYDYFVYRYGTDEFRFMPCASSFFYPQMLSVWLKSDDETISELAEKFSCNFWTVKECFRTMQEIDAKEELYA